jgi:hypothetical protein
VPVAAAAAALYGPLHGGANEAVLKMLDEIGSVGDPGLHRARQEGRSEADGLRPPGLQELRSARPHHQADRRPRSSRSPAKNPLIDIALELERIALQDDYFVQRKLYPNVDFYSGIIYQAMGFRWTCSRCCSPSAHRGLAGPVAGDAARSRAEDRPPAPVIAVVAGVVGVFGAIVYWYLESRAETRYRLGEAGETDKLVLGDLFRFGKSYWYVVGLCLVFYSAVLPFRTFAIKFFMEGHGTTREFGGFLNSLLPLSAMVATPLFGLLVDKVARGALFMLSARRCSSLPSRCSCRDPSWRFRSTCRWRCSASAIRSCQQ